MRLDPDRPKVPDVMPRVRELYASPNGGAGCCLHIVLDDVNTDDGSVDFCIEYAREAGHPTCEALARTLRQMSKTQRTKLATER